MLQIVVGGDFLIKNEITTLPTLRIIRSWSHSQVPQ